MDKDLPRRLATARKARGLSQAELSAAADIPHLMMLSAWKRGQHLPRVDYLAAMARVLAAAHDVCVAISGTPDLDGGQVADWAGLLWSHGHIEVVGMVSNRVLKKSLAGFGKGPNLEHPLSRAL